MSFCKKGAYTKFSERLSGFIFKGVYIGDRLLHEALQYPTLRAVSSDVPVARI